MSKPALRHRHFVAVPLMVLTLVSVGLVNQLVSASPIVGESSDVVMESLDQERQFSLASGITLLLSPASKVLVKPTDSMEMTTGTALIKASGFASIDAGFGLHVDTLFSSLLVTRDTVSATIAALTFPVIVATADHRYIVSPGYQLRIDSAGAVQTSAVPEVWHREQIASSHMLPVTPLSLGDNSKKTILARVLYEPDAVISFSSVHAAFALADTLGESSLSFLTALRLAVLSDRLDQESLNLVTKHIAAETSLSGDRVLAIPALALTALKPLPQGLIDLWVHDTIRAAAADPVSTASVLHPVLSILPGRYDDAGYPKQAEYWRAAITNVSQSLSPLLTAASLDQFHSDVSMALYGVSTDSDTVVGSLESSVALEVQHTYPASDLLASARQILLDAGVLFTTATTLTMDDALANCVRVTGIFIQQDSQDIPYEFSLCPLSKTVRSIKRNGSLLPNAVSLSQFFPEKAPST